MGVRKVNDVAPKYRKFNNKYFWYVRAWVTKYILKFKATK